MTFEQNLHYHKRTGWLNRYERNVLSVVSRGVIWETGRQGTGYEKSDISDRVGVRWVVQRALAALGTPDHYDAWLLRYNTGSEIPQHTDPAQPGMCHVRLNALITESIGGELLLEDKKMPLSEGDAYIFRPDIASHSVSAVDAGSRLVLSVGANVDSEQAQALGLA